MKLKNDKFIVLGDLHIGRSNDDVWKEKYISEYLKTVIDYAVENGITKIIQTGDVFDNQSALTRATLKTNRMSLIDPIIEAGIELFLITGNHDLRSNDVISTNAIREVFSRVDSDLFHIFDKPATIDINGLKIDMIPWICKENSEEVFEFIKNSNARMAVGHFELNGFMYNRLTPSKGLEPDFLSGYETVLSGHYHMRNSGRNVNFVGTPYGLSFDDMDEVKGFHVYNPYDLTDVEFVANPDIWYKSIEYRDGMEIDLEDYKNVSVRVVINEKVNQKKYSNFIDDLSKFAHKITFRDNYTFSAHKDVAENSDKEVMATGGVFDIGKERIMVDELVDENRKEIVVGKFHELYLTALSMREGDTDE